MMSSPSSPQHLIFDFGKDLPAVPKRRFKHPMAAMVHVAFKALAVLIYLFGGLFGQSFLTTFVLLIFLISVDFWTTKNVTGRLLVGLRWWNYVDEEGNSHWVFENRQTKEQGDLNLNNLLDSDTESAGDAKIFWSALVLTPFAWFLLLIITIFRVNIHWFVVVMLALVLSLSNMYGYLRCKVGSKDMKSTFAHYVGKRVFLNFLNSSQEKSNASGPNPRLPT